MEQITTAVTTGLSTMQSDILGMIAIAIPGIFVLVAVFFGVKKVIGFFRSNAK